MAKNLKRMLSAVLAIAMITGLAMPAFAAETIWQGDDVQLSFEAGVDPYVYAIAQDPANNRWYYETSNHAVQLTGGGAVHIFPMVDTTKVTGKWEPSGIYESGVSNYDVMYCCDAITGTDNEAYYKRVNLEDSEYFTDAQAKKLRAIVENAYPYVSVEEAKLALMEAGFAQAEKLDRSELITATQAAIWIISNPDSGDTYRYAKTAKTGRKLLWGGYMHEFADEITNFADSKTSTGYLTNPNGVGDRINALIDFYLAMEGVEAKNGQIVITNLDVSNTKLAKSEDLYAVEINVALNHGADDNDNVTLNVYVDGVLSETVNVTEETNYTVALNAKANANIKVVVSGTQNLERGEYFYTPEPQDIDGDGIATSREVSQNLIGVANGETPVCAEENFILRKIDKYAENFDGDFVDVTLEVTSKVDYIPGGKLPVDIIYIIGRFLSLEDVKADTMIQALTDTFRELINDGVPVNFGIVPFSSTKDPVMPLISLTSEADLEALPEKIAAAIQEAGNVYDGVNMENALLTATEMFGASELGQMGRTDRQHLVMISSGHTYYFNSGDNNEYISTVPVRFTKGSEDTNEIFYWEKAWMRARNNTTNSYPVPQAISEYYKANADKYASEWDCYWSLIDAWAKADIAAGDTVVYEATTREAGNFISWFNSGKKPTATHFPYSGNGKVIADLGDNEIENVLKFDMDDGGTNRGPSPFIHEYAAHAIGNERAMWEAYTFIQKNITGKGINFYPVYNPLRADGTASNGSHYDYTWTTNYIGHCFMNMLAGGEAVWYSADKVFFDDIKAEIVGGSGSASGEAQIPFVEDFIGFGEDYDFDFTGEKIVLTFNGVPYTTNVIATAEGATASYEFVDANGKVGFKMDYFRGNGTTEERFVWYFLQSITGEDNVELTYQLKLVTKSAEVGIHVAETNQSATLYPNGDREYGQLFPVPEVQYTNYPPLEGDKETAEDFGNGRFEINVTVPGCDPENVHDEVILMVDGSYSMDNEWPAMKEAIISIGKAVLNGHGNTQLTLMAFGMGDNQVLVHVKSAEALANALGELPGNLLYGRSSTNCESGFTGVAEYIANHDGTLGKVDVIFISDGNLNTDETPRAFDANWQTWTKFGALTVAQVAFEETVLYGENLPAAFTTVFGDRFNGATAEEILDRAFGGEVTDEEFIAFAEQLWTDVYAYSGLTRGEAYPVSDAERAFVKYDKENGTYIQDLFYYTTYKSAYVTYNDRWTRTPAAADALAAMDEVNALYVVDYDGYTAWMDTGITSEKATFVQSNGITGLLEALKETLTELSKTPYTDVVVTDYMSKWVNIDLSTLKIVDNRTGETIWSAAEGWLINENRPTAQENPVIVELVDPADYENGGADVIGNTSGDIYKLTWYVKDGALLRSDNYKLVYEVTVDIEEPGFVYGKDLPANGNTYIEYEGGRNEIKVPTVNTPAPTYTVTYKDGEEEVQKTPDLPTGEKIPGCEKPADFTADGYRYTFVGWELKSGTEGSDSTIGTTDLVYVAVYEKTIDRITISFENGDASNISFMLIDKETGKVTFLQKIDIGGQTSFEIPTEAGKISAVFVKQSTSGMFWFAEEVDEDLQQAVIDCLKANNPSYKGHNAVCFGAGDHELEFKKNKFVTYTFDGAAVVDKSDEPVDEEPVVEEEPIVEEETVVEEETKKNNGNNGNGNGNNKNKDKNKNKNKNK